MNDGAQLTRTRPGRGGGGGGGGEVVGRFRPKPHSWASIVGEVIGPEILKKVMHS